jgi:hypothetical protein
MAVGMRHQFIGFLARRIQAHRMIDIVMHRKRHFGIGAVYRAAGRIHKVFYTGLAAALQDIGKAEQIGIDVSHRIFDGVAHADLRCKIHYPVRIVFAE